MASARQDLRRHIPSVERLLQSPRVQALLERYSRVFVLDAIRAILDELRRDPARAGAETAEQIEAHATDRLETHLCRAAAPRLRRVVNATGIVLHTNLGRALLAAEAVRHVVEAATHPVTLEYDLDDGERGSRDALVEADLVALTGAQAATVVNNNAAAVLLALNALADGREAITSRGELVEIGGSFRIPEVMAKSGARLREVGTTNRTHLADYRRAIGRETGLLLKVHTSNYRIVGFTAEVSLGELVALGKETGVPVVVDLGSGALVDLGQYGLPGEPVVAEAVAAGADVVTFSGDKLLGGPQAGLMVGTTDAIATIRRNPLRRALRPGKLDLAALEATLRLYRQSPALASELPTMRWLTRRVEDMEAVGRAAIPLLQERLGAGHDIELVATESEVGSGALPDSRLPSRALAIRHPTDSPDAIARRFRGAVPPVIGRVSGGVFLLDLRGIFAPEELAVHVP
jgi:L-seryl-tRNA(Ser) seleniumtransferase